MEEGFKMFYGYWFRQCPMGSVVYIIKQGDLLYKIAQRFNTTVEAIIAVNPGLDPYRLYIGQQICVPQQQPQPYSCPIGTSPYEVKSGDTLVNIAGKFNTTVASIILTNPDIDPDRINVGQQLCITEKQPQQDTTCPTLNTYVIQRGDILSAIARVFNVSVQDILNINPGIDPNNLSVGAIICIPVAPSPLSIRISLRAKTLGLYRSGTLVKTYPVATGKPTTPTPTGNFTIVNKQVNPGGPFGTRWMGLSKPHYGIHGTNNPASIGTEASNGCIRMFNDDVNELFSQIPVNTTVRIF
jgi:L,D-transpeptidase ErfK/SrfK